MKTAIHILRNAKLACAFRSWKRWIPVQKEQIQLMNALILRMNKQTLAAGFQGWLTGAFHSREMRVKCEMVVTLIMNHTVAGEVISWSSVKSKICFQEMQRCFIVAMHIFVLHCIAQASLEPDIY